MAPLTRRSALKHVGMAGAGFALAPVAIRGQATPITVAGRPVEIAIASVSASTVRITIRPIAGGAAQNVVNRGALVPAADARETGRWRESFMPVRAGDLTVQFLPSVLPGIAVFRAGRLVQMLTLSAAASAIHFSLGEGRVFGLGEGGPQFDRKGNTFGTRNGQGGYQLRTHGGRVPIQWLVSTDGWGMYIHQPLGAFGLTSDEGVLTPTGDALPLDVFVVASSDPKVIIGEYARITGFAELPPLWSLGYMQSHRTLAGPDEISWVARTMREKKLPCDALIYLGTEFTPSGWNTRNGEFAWKTENFPDPKRFIDEMHAQHYKVVLHVVIEGRRMSGAVADPCTPDKAVPSGRTTGDQWPEDRPVPCYWPYHKPLYDLGVDGMWPDQGDGLDEPSRLARIVARGDQFLWGRDLLVSPVVEKGATTRRLYLPRGSWFDFWTEERVEGEREIDRAVDLETMPLHVRAGAIVPMGPIKQYVDEPVEAPLSVTIYSGADGAFTLYEDDGKTFAHKKGDFMRLAMTWNDASGRFSVRLAPESRLRPPVSRHIEVRLAGTTTPRRLVLEGKPDALSLR